MNLDFFNRAIAAITGAGGEIFEAHYGTGFGSWFVTVGPRPCLQLVWDGKDGWLMAKRQTDRLHWGYPVFEDVWVFRKPSEEEVDAGIQKFVEMLKGR